MKLPERAAIRAAYDEAVVAFLNASPDCEEHEAEAFVDAMAQLIFTTMESYIYEENNHVGFNHH